MIAAAALGVVALAMLLVVVQSPGAWKAAAEHSKVFWLVWAVVLVGIGAAPAVALDEVPPSGGLLVWLLFCCALAALQPSLLVDVRDTRRHRRRVHAARARRRDERACAELPPFPVELLTAVPAVPVAAAPVAVGAVEPEPIRWLAPEGALA